MSDWKGLARRLLGTAVVGLVLFPAALHAQAFQGKVDSDGVTSDQIREMLRPYMHVRGGDRNAPMDLPDVDGPGSVLNVGRIYMKVTNWGHCGNLFTNRSSDPAGQWPGASGVEYLSSFRIAVGAVNRTATDPAAVRRVSYLFEWRPPTLDPEDRIYRAYDGIINGSRFVNDDGDEDLEHHPIIDEDFLDGRDNDGDGKIDEDHAALGQQEFSLVMRDDTPEAVNTPFNEKHVPLGLEIKQRAWAYSILGFQDFNVVEYEVTNKSGHTLDSLVMGWSVDMDAGPVDESGFFADDLDAPEYPQGEFVIKVGQNEGELNDPERIQFPHSPVNVRVRADSALCPRQNIRINGFSIGDDNGDDNRTRGVPSFLLVNHTVDPLGVNGPRRVGFTAFRSFTAGKPYVEGGAPSIDQQRFEFMTGSNGTNNNINPETGFIRMEQQNTEKGDYVQWCSIGPWRNVPDGGKVTATVAFAVSEGTLQLARRYPLDYQRSRAGTLSNSDLLQRYPSVRNGLTVQLAYEGIHERREGFPTPSGTPHAHGRETCIQLPKGSPPQTVYEECGGSSTPRPVNDRECTWFDFDCDYCTGVWSYALGASDPTAGGLFHKTWNAQAPPPNPNANVAGSYNYNENPSRNYAPAGDRQITLAWDNLSEATPDPKTGWLDFRGYRIWKVSDWRRPIGSPGPSDDDWTLLGEFRQFKYYNLLTGDSALTNRDANGDCPKLFIPNWLNPATGVRDTATVAICLEWGDLWNRQTGEIIKPDTSLHCVGDFAGVQDSCVGGEGCIVGNRQCTNPANRRVVRQRPIGYYKFVDHEVKNGFTYFYSVTAFDSTVDGGLTTQLGGRRSAIEAEGVTPQVSTLTGKKVWVVPNPYRGYQQIDRRPSSWDLIPNASDPTGTHIDFMGLPSGGYTIRIFTVSGDLVAIIRSSDPVNESVRVPVKDPVTQETRPGFNRQQDDANDGQARWNLISRNGQDVVSGIYIFTVESSQGTQRGKFVIIR